MTPDDPDRPNESSEVENLPFCGQESCDDRRVLRASNTAGDDGGGRATRPEMAAAPEAGKARRQILHQKDLSPADTST